MIIRTETNKRVKLAALTLAAGLLVSALTLSAVRPDAPVSAAQHALSFELNAGQAGAATRFVTHAAGGTISFAPTEVAMMLPAGPESGVHMQFLEADPSASVQGGRMLPGKANYLIGNDPSKWRAGLPTYAGISYKKLYPGVDLAYTGNDGLLEGTYTLAPGAMPDLIRWKYDGAQDLTVDSAGNLQVSLQGSEATLTEHTPVAWQELDGRKIPVAVSYLLSNDSDSVGFLVGSYDHARPLTIDPTITYSTYLGGSIADSANSVAVDNNGNAYVVGQTYSPDFPTQNPRQPQRSGTSDAFITKFNPDGTVAYSTYLGGIGEDNAGAVRVEGVTGVAYIAGRTYSADFPTQNAYRATLLGGEDAFITKLSADGSTLLYSTLFGGNGTDYAWGIAVDAASNAYITGVTTGPGLPVRNAYQSTWGGAADAFLARLSTNASGDASLVYATYLGGSGNDFGGGGSNTEMGHGVAADDNGNAYITGQTLSTNFPTVNAYQSTWANTGNPIAFVSRINTNASGAGSLTYSTYLGDTSAAMGHDIATGSTTGVVYVTGNTAQANNTFPVRNSYAPCFAGPFVTKLDTGLSGDGSLLYSTCFGQNGTGTANSIAANNGVAYVTGDTSGSSFPLVQAVQGYGGGHDAFVLALDAPGNSLLFSTYLGGSGTDSGNGIAVGGNHAYVAGATGSANFPLLHQFQGFLGGLQDGFVTNLDLAGPAPTFTPVPPSATPTPDPCGISYTDVPPGSVFYDFIHCLACQGIINGYSDGTFRPNNNVTRGQLAKIVANSAAFNEVHNEQTFEDVPVGSTFHQFIERMASRNIISGYSCGGPGEPCGTGSRPYFRPGNNATRGQISKIVSNARDYQDPPGNQVFADVAPDSTFYLWIGRLASRGTMSGYPCGGPGEPCGAGNLPYFRPGNNATRGQTSKIVSSSFFPGCELLRRR